MRRERFKQYVRGERDEQFETHLDYGHVRPDYFSWGKGDGKANRH